MLGLSAHCSGAHAKQARSNIYVYPSTYAAEGIGDSSSQVLVGGAFLAESSSQNSVGWSVGGRAELESFGRKQLFVDVDRTFVSFEQTETFPRIVVGRVHPFLVSKLAERLSPWGLVYHRQTLTRGLQLGYGWNSDAGTPGAALSGWLGVQTWRTSGNWGYGFAVAPVYIPSLGATASIDDPKQASRFARRVPSRVVVNGQNLALEPEIVSTNLFEDVVLRPQFLAHARHEFSVDQTTWAWAGYYPRPEPVLYSEGFLQATDTSVTAIARVSPKFEQRLHAGLTHDWRLAKSFGEPRLQASLHWEDPYWGGEVGVSSDFGGIRYSHQFSDDKATYLWSLVELRARVPFGKWALQVAHRVHTHRKDAWSLASVQGMLTESCDLAIGVDVFTGAGGTFFGEWRNNDRVFGVLRWNFES